MIIALILDAANGSPIIGAANGSRLYNRAQSIIDAANGSPRADLGHRAASQPRPPESGLHGSGTPDSGRPDSGEPGWLAARLRAAMQRPDLHQPGPPESGRHASL